MKHQTWFWLLVLGVFGLLTESLTGQEVFKTKVREVYLAVRVYQKGKAVTSLEKSNFRIWEVFADTNGREQRLEQTINNLSVRARTPLAIIATIDSSFSMRRVFSKGQIRAEDKLEMARHACSLFFRSVFNPLTDRALISEFYQSPPRRVKTETGAARYVVQSLRVVQDWTNDSQQIAEAIGKIKNPGGLTPLRDAVFELAGYFQKLEGEYLRVMVVLSDGGDAPSTHLPGSVVVNLQSLEAVIERLQNQQVLIFAVGLYDQGWSFWGLGGKDVLEEMSQATGGEAFFQTNLSKLFEVFREIEGRIREVNFLSYTPRDQTPGLHAIEMEVGDWKGEKWKKRGGLKIFHRLGYTIEKSPTQSFNQ